MKYLFVIILVVLTASAAIHAEPVLQIVAPHFDFGWVPHSSTVEHYYWFKSVGTDSLIIDPIRTGFSALEMPIDQRLILPGDSVMVPLIWHTPKRAGRMQRQVTIITNGLPDEPYELEVEGITVLEPDSMLPVAISPFKIELARYSRISIDSLAFTLTNHSDKEFSVRMVSQPPGQCELVFPDKLDAGKSAVGYVKLRENWMDREFTTSVTLQYDYKSGYRKRITLPIRRKIFNQ